MEAESGLRRRLSGSEMSSLIASRVETMSPLSIYSIVSCLHHVLHDNQRQTTLINSERLAALLIDDLPFSSHLSAEKIFHYRRRAFWLRIR